MFACWFYAFVRRKFHHLCALLRPRSTTPLCHLAYQCPVGSGGGREGTQTIYVCWNNRIHFELNVLSGLQVLNYNWMAYSVPKAGLGESRNWWNVENVLLFSITWLNADKRQVNSVTWTVFFQYGLTRGKEPIWLWRICRALNFTVVSSEQKPSTPRLACYNLHKVSSTPKLGCSVIEAWSLAYGEDL